MPTWSKVGGLVGDVVWGDKTKGCTCVRLSKRAWLGEFAKLPRIVSDSYDIYDGSGTTPRGTLRLWRWYACGKNCSWS